MGNQEVDFDVHMNIQPFKLVSYCELDKLWPMNNENNEYCQSIDEPSPSHLGEIFHLVHHWQLQDFQEIYYPDGKTEGGFWCSYTNIQPFNKIFYHIINYMNIIVCFSCYQGNFLHLTQIIVKLLFSLVSLIVQHFCLKLN